MARKKVARVKDKWTTKKWFTLIAPEYFGMTEVGETPANSPEIVVGRTVETTLADLTGDTSNQNPYKKLVFKVHKVAGEKAYTKFHRFELMREYLNSLVRRRTSKIEDVVDIKTADGYMVRVKPVVFTVKRCKTSQRRAIRAISRQVILSKSSLNFVQFLQECILGKIPSEIYKGTKKIYPIRRVEVRRIELLSEPKTGVVAG
ncbi:MAG: 30S ribosomal protein S3ae [Archaeoglobaceae archaeon]|nr:30S ribosomal protein S3ae [Archaeoglobaceae archaeon]MDW7989145.1 30S ribosomal protein S3ae [Archaeoglobaceae archaeon]